MKTVLLIDDDDDSLQIYRAALRHRGYRVRWAKGPDAGYRSARRHRPDLIVTELFTRTRTGWLTPELLRGDPETAGIPLIAVSAHALEEDRERALRAGCDDFIAKPLEPLRLVEEVERRIGRADGERGRAG